MKLHTDRNEVERSNVEVESSFKIKTTAKAFSILSEGLYTDRILAVVRELSCNAYDAHVAANNSDPFEIHLPNRLEPWFHVKDYGTGLSDEDVMNLYSTYFDSTKTNSNDYIGALGLGSKSPFSYTKSFEVISRFDHVRRIYSIFINEDGVPTIAKMGEVVTDEHNGLEVRITVKPDDFWAFQEKVRTALRWFPVKPTIVGIERFDWPTISNSTLSGEGWSMFDSTFTRDYSRMTAVQGNVAYKVDITSLPLEQCDKVLLEHSHVVGFFNIGELEVAASREEIRYDERSQTALMNRIKAVREGILLSVESKIEKLESEGTSLWNMMIVLNKIGKEMFGSNGLFNEFIKSSKNKAIQSYLATNGQIHIPSLIGHEVIAYTLSRGGDPGKASVKRSYFHHGYEPSEDMVVFYNDVKSGGITRISHYLRTQAWTAVGIKPTIVVAIRRLEKVTVTKIVPNQTTPEYYNWTEPQFDDEMKKLVDSLCGAEIKLVSDAPIPPRGRNGSTHTLPIFQFEKVNVRKYGKSTIDWKRVAPDLSKDSLYFFIRNGSYITVINSDGKERDVSWEVSKAKDYIEASINLINESLGTSYSMKNVFAIGSQAAKKIAKLPNWTNLFDILKTQMEQFKPAAEFFCAATMTDDLMGLRDLITKTYMHSNYKALVTRVKKMKNSSSFKKTLMPLIEDAEKYTKMSMACTFLQKLDVDLGTKVFDNSKVKRYYEKNAFDVYPMLGFISSFQYLSNAQVKLFFDYIDTIDRS